MWPHEKPEAHFTSHRLPLDKSGFWMEIVFFKVHMILMLSMFFESRIQSNQLEDEATSLIMPVATLLVISSSSSSSPPLWSLHLCHSFIHSFIHSFLVNKLLTLSGHEGQVGHMLPWCMCRTRMWPNPYRAHMVELSNTNKPNALCLSFFVSLSLLSLYLSLHIYSSDWGVRTIATCHGWSEVAL